MRCEQFERRLQETLDARTNPDLDEPLRDHAGVCQECRELLATYDGLLATVAVGWVPRGPRRLNGQIVSQWRQSVECEPESVPGTRRVRGWQVVAGSFACAAAMLVALMPLLQRPEGSDAALVAVPLGGSSPSASKTDGNNLRPEQLGSVAHQTGRGIALLVLQFPDYDTANPDGELESQVPWLRPVASSLKPLSSVGEPFNVLLRATGTRGGQAHSS